MEAGPAFVPGPLQRIDKRLEKMERLLARQRPEHDPNQQDPGSLLQ